jgi:hypothetical protein
MGISGCADVLKQQAYIGSRHAATSSVDSVSKVI